jgi:hypothetical protein
MRCDYAACPDPAEREADGFRFCLPHLGDHLRQQVRMTPPVRIAKRGRPGTEPCGTHAAYNRHKAHGEDPCFPCALAERIYQRQRPDRRTGARRRRAS